MTERVAGSPPEDGPGEAIDRPTAAEAEPGMLRSSAVMAVGTIVSRATGLLRNIALVAAIGFGTLSDAFSLGNTLPTIIYILIVGGALNAVFVPQLVRHFADDDDRGQGYADRLLTLTGIVLIVLSVVSVVAAPWIVDLYAAENYTPHDLAVATAFARLCLPQIFFYGAYTMLSQVLNSRGHFGMPMFAPIVNNIVAIATFGAFVWIVGDTATMATITDTQILLLGIGTTLGVALQALVLVPALRGVDYRFRPRFGYRGYGLGKTAVLAGWTIGLVLVNQLGFVVTTRLATAANVNAAAQGTVAQGLTTYQNAYSVFILPQSVITVSIVTALLPRLSRAAGEGRIADVASGVGNGTRMVAALIVPSAALLAVFGPIITSLFFNVGAGSGAAATYAGLVVSAFAIGLLPFAVFYLLLRGWYAVEDTRTPFIATIIFNVVLMAFTIPLYYAVGLEAKVLSLAVAYSAAYWLVMVVAWIMLSRKIGSLGGRSVSGSVARMMIAAVVASVVALGALALTRLAYIGLTGEQIPWSLSGAPLAGMTGLAVGGIAGLAVYVGVCHLLRVEEVAAAVRMASSKLPLPRRG